MKIKLLREKCQHKIGTIIISDNEPVEVDMEFYKRFHAVIAADVKAGIIEFINEAPEKKEADKAPAADPILPEGDKPDKAGEEPPADQPAKGEDLGAMTVKELQAIAEELKIEEPKKMKKGLLIKAIKEARA